MYIFARTEDGARKGEKLVGKKSGKYYERTNIVTGYVNHKSIAPMIFNGTCNTKLFETWVEKFLIKELEPGQVVVMDNPSFHKSQKTRELIKAIRCRLVFLPPANMKRWIKAHISNFGILYNALELFYNAQIST